MKGSVVVEVVHSRDAVIHPRRTKVGYRGSDPRKVVYSKKGPVAEELPIMQGDAKAMRARERYIAARALARAHMHEYTEECDFGDEACEIGQRTPPTETPRTSSIDNVRNSCYVEILEEGSMDDEEEEDELLDDEFEEEDEVPRPNEPAIEELYEACVDRTAEIPVGGWQSCALDEIDELYQDSLSPQEKPNALEALNEHQKRQRKKWSLLDIISQRSKSPSPPVPYMDDHDEITLTVLSASSDEFTTPTRRPAQNQDLPPLRDCLDDNSGILDDEKHFVQHRR